MKIYCKAVSNNHLDIVGVGTILLVKFGVQSVAPAAGKAVVIRVAELDILGSVG